RTSRLPTPPAGAGSPFAWGREEVVRELLSDAFELDIEERITTSNVATGEEYWLKHLTKIGASYSIRRGLTSSTAATGRAAESHTREYLLVVGTRR
ncbi:MAG TPA: hypothetical protein VHH53_02850, partial [Pseudonocardiaceae bacterium]|nr:hypothetical protein [Pseudonocardiaceae bacterium]